MTIRNLKRLITALLTLITPSLAFSAEPQSLNMANTAWIITASILVLFMTLPGLALFYGGLVRTKNVLSVLMQCFTITCMVSLVWILFAYSLAFSDGGANNAWIGGMAVCGKPLRRPSTNAATNAATPALICTTVPPAKSSRPSF